MKKFIALGISVLLLLLMVGCGDRAKPEKKPVMGFSQIGAESEWRKAHTESIKIAAKEAGIELQFSDGEQQQEYQIKAIRSFIAQKVDIIAFVPIVETGWDQVLKEAKDARIPVIIVDRDVKVFDDSLYAAKIGTDSVTEGNNAARWLQSYMRNSNRHPRAGGEKYNIVILEGTAGSSVSIRRQEGFKRLLKADQYNILASENGDYVRQRGQELMESMLRDNRDKIDAVFSHNDDMALGAIQAIEAAGLRPGKDIVVVSVDGIKDIFQAMIDGRANCTIECNPLQGPLLMAIAKQLLAGEKVDKLVYVPGGIFPADIAAEKMSERKY